MVHACWIYRTLVCALWFCDVGHQAIYQDLDFLAHIGVASYSYYADPSKAYDASRRRTRSNSIKLKPLRSLRQAWGRQRESYDGQRW